MIRKTSKKITICIFVFLIIFCVCFNINIKAFADKSDLEIDGYTIDDIRNVVSNRYEQEDNNRYLTIYSQNGEMEDVIFEEDENSLETIQSHSIPSFNVRKIVDSGKDDEDSIVITFMGDGFTSSQQSLFITAATSAANSLINQYPMRLYKDYFSIYAIEVISNESGVSRDVSNFNWWSNNPSVDNYFGSTYWYDGNIFNQGTERMLYIKNESRARELEHEGSVLSIIICNSMRWGGAAGEFACSSLSSGYENIVSHEFGHAFANLADEYFWRGREAPNMTKNSNTATIKWSDWIDSTGTGIYNIGAYQYGPSGEEAEWYRPHQNCKMKSSSNSFCAVCSAEIIKLLGNKTGVNISTFNLPDNTIRINKFNIDYTGALNIPLKMNGRYVSMIGSEAFKGYAGLSSVIIPNCVKSISPSAFEDCNNLTSVTLPNALTSIGDFAFKRCSNLSCVTLPNLVINIGKSSFENCTSLSDVTLSNNLTSIGSSAFKGCTSLATLTIPNNVTNIDSSTFENCTNLQNLTLSTSLVSIGSSAFKGCTSLTTLTIPNNVTNIDPGVFENCTDLQNLTLSTGLTYIGYSAFRGCSSLTAVTIPNNVVYIYPTAFENCTNLQDLTLSTSLIRIGEAAFRGCNSLTVITMPNSLINILSCAFENCIGLQTVNLSSNLCGIGSSAFKGCTSLTSLTIPSSVLNIEFDAFRNCSSLSLVNVQREVSSITNLGMNVFSGCNQSLQIKVPMNRVAEYKNKTNWVSYKSKITSMTDNYSEINLNCMSDFYNLTTLGAGYNKLYKLNVECAKTYKIFTNSNLDVSFIIYNSNMDNVATGQNTITTYLAVGTYYLSIEFNNNSDNGLIVTNYKLAWGNQGEDINNNTCNDVLTHLHQTSSNSYKSKLKYYHGQATGFYKFVLSGTDLYGDEITYPSSIITIYSDSSRSNILDRYDLTNNINFATNEVGENVMYVYLPYNGYYYIDINTNNDEYESLTLNVLPVSGTSFDFLNTLETSTENNIFEGITDVSYFRQVTISHKSKFILEVSSDDVLYAGLPIYVFQKVRDPGCEPGDDQFYIVPILVSSISNTDASDGFTIILDAGTYYFGYSDNDEMSLSFNLTRLVDYSVEMYDTLITDPGAGFVPGSEVRFNNGNYGGLTITEGFTRNLFFSSEYVDNTEVSRLDYDWYSSNPNIAFVSEFGTVLALRVNQNTNVKIYAINKADPSIIYCIELIILKETSTDEIEIFSDMSYSYQEENGFYQLELDFANCPYPMIQYYGWNVYSDDILVDIYWGYVTSSGAGFVSLVGTYWLNPRVHIFINLTITE